MRIVRLYTSDNCPFCKIVESYLRCLEIPFGEIITIETINIDEIEVNNITTLPTIAIEGNYYPGIMDKEILREIVLS